jgi:Fe-Mn family superoxide dismutase
MKTPYNRRVFLKDSSKIALAAGVGVSLMSSGVLKANDNPFQQKALPYSYSALEPFIDTTTMEIHYSKHAATYAKNLADACLAEKVNATSVSLESLMQNISKYSAKMRNNGGGHYNHEFFWKCMKPGNSSTPSGKILSSINQSFGSFEAFKTQFSEAAKNRFGSGWAWLIQSTDGTLKCSSTANQDNPLMDIVELKGKPLLALDVWEHAYYLKYQNKRPDYINNWFNLVDWNFVENQLR